MNRISWTLATLIVMAVVGLSLWSAKETRLAGFRTPPGSSVPTLSSEWSYVDCYPTGRPAQLITDTTQFCDGIYLVEDTNGVADFIAAPQGDIYFRLRAGATGAATVAGDGIGITFANAFIHSATTTAMMETSARIGVVENATTSSFVFLGFANTTGLAPDYASQPDGCMFVASSTAANWFAVCKNGSNYSQINTLVASSTVLTGDGSFNRFRVNIDNASADFYIQQPSGTLVSVGNISGMSVASTTALNPLVALGQNFAGVTHDLHVRDLKVWYLNPLW